MQYYLFFLISVSFAQNSSNDVYWNVLSIPRTHLVCWDICWIANWITNWDVCWITFQYYLLSTAKSQYTKASEERQGVEACHMTPSEEERWSGLFCSFPTLHLWVRVSLVRKKGPALLLTSACISVCILLSHIYCTFTHRIRWK